MKKRMLIIFHLSALPSSAYHLYPTVSLLSVWRHHYHKSKHHTQTWKYPEPLFNFFNFRINETFPNSHCGDFCSCLTPKPIIVKDNGLRMTGLNNQNLSTRQKLRLFERDVDTPPPLKKQKSRNMERLVIEMCLLYFFLTETFADLGLHCIKQCPKEKDVEAKFLGPCKYENVSTLL